MTDLASKMVAPLPGNLTIKSANGKVYVGFDADPGFQVSMRTNVRASHTIMAKDATTAFSDLRDRLCWLRRSGRYANTITTDQN